jgi:diguanylate cyclase (GGDEF)-like protein
VTNPKHLLSKQNKINYVIEFSITKGFLKGSLLENSVLKNLSILYVEDEKELRLVVEENISYFVKDVITAVNGEEGLELFTNRRDEIDLIITDILMPKIDGIEMVKNIRKLDINVPIIFTTAFSDTEYLQKAAGLSVDGYIMKPIDIEELMNAIQKASLKVDNIRLSKELEDTAKKLNILNKNLEAEVEKKAADLKALNIMLEKKNKELSRQLYTDELTGIFNRKALVKDLETAINPFVAIIDIDAFKSINSFYGSEIGNFILIEFAKFLNEIKKESDIRLYRTGSDEFVLLKENATECTIAENFIKEIIKKIKQKVFYHPKIGHEIDIDITIGASSFKKGDCLKNADLALKKAKKERLPYLFYSDKIQIEREFENDIKWTKIVKEAISENRVVLYFQPIVDLNKNIKKYECLVRLIENEEIVPPFFFLEVAKKAKLYPSLTKIIIEKAFEISKDKNIVLTINLSAQDITDEEMVEYIKSKLNEYGVAKNIVFEILESESIYNFDKALKFINDVKQMGAMIAIDDFGSGYSNFSYLLKLKPDFIKIDGSLIKNIDKDDNAYIIVKTIVEFAKKLDIKTVGEFVHSEDVFKRVAQIGIDKFQGFYFGKPEAILK